MLFCGGVLLAVEAGKCTFEACMSYQPETPFDNIESALEYVNCSPRGNGRKRTSRWRLRSSVPATSNGQPKTAPATRELTSSKKSSSRTSARAAIF